MDNIDLSNIKCNDEEQLDKILLEELKHQSRLYGLDQHGTKITLCKNINSYLNAIKSNESELLNSSNIDMIHSIYDLIRVLKIDDLNELHNLDEDEIDFLWETIKTEENIDLDSDLDKIKTVYKTSNILDLKIVILIDILSKLFCKCIKSKSKYGKEKGNICRKTILKRRHINSSKYSCDGNNNILLPKFGSKEVLYYTNKK